MDIVCRDKRHNELVFIEVKTRTREELADPFDAVDHKKRRLMVAGSHDLAEDAGHAGHHLPF